MTYVFRALLPKSVAHEDFRFERTIYSKTDLTMTAPIVAAIKSDLPGNIIVETGLSGW